MSEDNGQQGLTFDFGKASGSWRRDMLRTTALETRVTAAINRVTMNPDNTDADIDDMMTQLDKLEAAQSALMAQVLVEIPRSWLMDDAPEDLKASDPAVMEWVRQDRRADLFTAMMQASQRPAGKA